MVLALIVGNWLIDPNTSWKYSDTYVNGWKLASFDDSAWDEAAAGSFTPISGSTVTRYYRVTTTSLRVPTVFAGFQIGAKTNVGIICYLNGEEVFRRNLPLYSLSPCLNCRSQVTDRIPASTSLPNPVFY